MRSVLKALWQQVDRLLTVGGVPDPVVLFSFSSARALRPWRLYSDKDFGGLSHGVLRFEEEPQQQQQHEQHEHEGSKASQPYAVLEGRYSRALGENCELVRCGYVGMSTLLPRSVNLSQQDHLEVTLRAHTPHAYVASLRTEQYTQASGEEAWQALIVPSRVGEWETVCLPLHSFVFTFRGRVATSTATTPVIASMRSSKTTSNKAGAQQQQRQQHAHELVAAGAGSSTSSAGARTLTRPECAHVVGLGLTLAATDDMPLEDDFRLDLASVRACTAPDGYLPDLAGSQLKELGGADAARLEWERRALRAAKRLSSPGERRERVSRGAERGGA